MLSQFEWIVALGGIFAFFAAYGIGANDVANAFATSVGSGALKIKHAIPLAAVCEYRRLPFQLEISSSLSSCRG